MVLLRALAAILLFSSGFPNIAAAERASRHLMLGNFGGKEIGFKARSSSLWQHTSAASRHSPSAKRSPANPISIYLAAAFHDNVHTLDSFERSCKELAELKSVSRLHITVYESGSTDGTDIKLLEIKQRFHERRKISTSFTLQGNITRNDRQRIEFLADIRNELIIPLQSLRTRYDYVVFANDVFFSANDVMKLINVGGDLVCGMDFTHLSANIDLQERLIESHSDGKEEARAVNPNEGIQVSPNLPIFYDIWVARTLDGLPFRNLPPYVPQNEGNIKILRDFAGGMPAFSDWMTEANLLPLLNEAKPNEVQPVQCCWNGLLAVRAEPFYRGLTFRSNLPSECLSASENHMCTDLWHMGYKRVAVHNGVRLSYTDAVRDTLEKIPAAPNGALSKEAADIFRSSPARATVCCGMRTKRRIHRELQQMYSRLPSESDRDFAFRVWKHISGDTLRNPGYKMIEEFVRLLSTFRPADVSGLSAFVNANAPHLPCQYEVPMHLSSQSRWSSKSRKIPPRITQIGPQALYDGLTPLTWTWRQLHPDHDYEFLSYDDVQSKGYVSPSLKSLLQRLQQHAMDDYFRDIAKYVVMLERGGIYADLDTIVTKSLSDDIAIRDADSFVVGLESDFRLQSTADEWRYPSRKGASSHFFATTPRNGLLQKILHEAVKNAAAVVDEHERGGIEDLGSAERNKPLNRKPAPFVTGSKIITHVLSQEKKSSGQRVMPLHLTSGSHLKGAAFYDAQRVRIAAELVDSQRSGRLRSSASSAYVHRYQPSHELSSLNTTDGAFEDPVLEWAGCVLRYVSICAIRFPSLRLT
jgi:hypothetical protein